jgi:hypothetical protein
MMSSLAASPSIVDVSGSGTAAFAVRSMHDRRRALFDDAPLSPLTSVKASSPDRRTMKISRAPERGG